MLDAAVTTLKTKSEPSIASAVASVSLTPIRSAAFTMPRIVPADVVGCDRADTCLGQTSGESLRGLAKANETDTRMVGAAHGCACDRAMFWVDT